MIDNPFGMTTDINGKPIPRWQDRLEDMYLRYVPFGEMLSFIRALLEERDIDAILNAPDEVILRGFTEEDAAKMRAEFDGVARLVAERDALNKKLILYRHTLERIAGLPIEHNKCADNVMRAMARVALEVEL